MNSGGSNSPWSEFWSEFPHFMGMGVVPAPSSKDFSSHVPSNAVLMWHQRRNSCRSAPKGRQQMGETGFCKNLRFSAVPCGFLRKSATPKSLIYRASRKSAKICKNLRKCAFRVRFLPFAVSLLARPDLGENYGRGCVWAVSEPSPSMSPESSLRCASRFWSSTPSGGKGPRSEECLLEHVCLL